MIDRPSAMPGPASELLTHRAPAGLLDRAMLREPKRRSRAPLAAFALAATFLLGAGLGWLARPAPEAPAAVAMGDQSVPVRLVFHDTQAQRVAVAGSWNNWDASIDPMQRADDGVFRAVVLLPPGVHEYMFVVDGSRWVTDATAALHREDGFGNRNAVLEL